MKYVYIDNDRMVREVIPAFVEEFPDVPVTDRYSKEFLSRCLEVDDSLDVQAGMEYLPLKNVFDQPLQYTGDATILRAVGERAVVAVSFNKVGTWEVTDTSSISVSTSDNSIVVNSIPEGEATISIVFSEAEYGRTLSQIIRVHSTSLQSTEPIT